MGTRRRIVMPYVFRSLPPFVRADVDALAMVYDVKVVPSRSLSELFKAARAAAGASVLICWFGSLRYFPAVVMARLVGRPVVIIAGGYDVARVPEIEYGNMRPGPSRWVGRILFRLATLVVPYSRAGESEAHLHAGVPMDKLQMVYLGLDASQFGEDVPITDKEPFVLTVASMNTSSVVRKGITTLLRASRMLPDVRFVVAGGADPSTLSQMRSLAGPNVEFAGFVNDERLAALFRAAKVYCQPSVHEAFGYALAEAMLYNALPVVSDRGSLPEVAGPSAIVAPVGDAAALARALREALSQESYGPVSPRAHIADTFPRARRVAALVSIIEGLT